MDRISFAFLMSKTAYKALHASERFIKISKIFSTNYWLTFASIEPWFRVRLDLLSREMDRERTVSNPRTRPSA